MTHTILSAIKAKKNWLTILLYLIAITAITLTLFHGGVGGRTPVNLFFFAGLIALFFALLNTWGTRTWKYYTVLLSILLILTFLPFFLPEEWDLVKVQANRQIPGHWAEDMAWSIGFILFAGYMAGIIGLFMSFGRKK